MYIFVNFANPLPSAHGHSILTRSAYPLRLREIIRLNVFCNLNVTKINQTYFKKSIYHLSQISYHECYERIIFFFFKCSKNIFSIECISDFVTKIVISLHVFFSFLRFIFKSFLLCAIAFYCG